MKRIYIIEGNGETNLVKATTKASAVRHIASKVFTAAVASQDQLVELASNGVKVEEAGEEVEEKELAGAGKK